MLQNLTTLSHTQFLKNNQMNREISNWEAPFLHISGPHSVVSGPVASAWPGKLLEMPVSRPHSKSTESDSWRFSDLVFNKPSRWFWCMIKFGRIILHKAEINSFCLPFILLTHLRMHTHTQFFFLIYRKNYSTQTVWLLL